MQPQVPNSHGSTAEAIIEYLSSEITNHTVSLDFPLSYRIQETSRRKNNAVISWRALLFRRRSAP